MGYQGAIEVLSLKERGLFIRINRLGRDDGEEFDFAFIAKVSERHEERLGIVANSFHTQ